MKRIALIAGSCLAAAALIGVGQSYLETSSPPAPPVAVLPAAKPRPPALARAQAPAPKAVHKTLGVEPTLSLLKSTTDWNTVDGCVVSLENTWDPKYLGPSLERLDQLGLLDKPQRLPWFSKTLLSKFLVSAKDDDLRRGLKLLAAKPALASAGLKAALAQRMDKESEPGAKAALAMELAQLKEGDKTGAGTPPAASLHN